MKKVNAIESSVAGLNTKLDAKVPALDSKLGAILTSLSDVTRSSPMVVEREAQLDHLIYLRLKHTVEEVEKKSNESLDHYLDTINIMLKVQEDMIGATNELIKQTHVPHEKQIKRMEKEINVTP